MPVDVCGQGIDLDGELAQSMEVASRQLLAATPYGDWELSVALTDDAGIRALNRTWRDKDAPTDVLSFPQGEDGLLGDLVISLETAELQAKARGHSLQDELRILLVHGFLHLCGYDHEVSQAEHLEMAEKERELLTRLGWIGEGLIALAEEAASGDEGSPTRSS